MKTKKERVKRLYNVLRKVLAGKVINEESLREGFTKQKQERLRECCKGSAGVSESEEANVKRSGTGDP